MREGLCRKGAEMVKKKKQKKKTMDEKGENNVATKNVSRKMIMLITLSSVLFCSSVKIICACKIKDYE